MTLGTDIFAILLDLPGVDFFLEMDLLVLAVQADIVSETHLQVWRDDNNM